MHTHKDLKMKYLNSVPSEAKHSNVWIRSTKAAQIVFIIVRCLTAEDVIHAFLTEDLRVVWMMFGSQS